MNPPDTEQKQSPWCIKGVHVGHSTAEQLDPTTNAFLLSVRMDRLADKRVANTLIATYHQITRHGAHDANKAALRFLHAGQCRCFTRACSRSLPSIAVWQLQKATSISVACVQHQGASLTLAMTGHEWAADAKLEELQLPMSRTEEYRHKTP